MFAVTVPRRKMAAQLESVDMKGRSGEEYVLADLLREWQVAPEFRQGISARWRCRIVPTATNEEVFERERDCVCLQIYPVCVECVHVLCVVRA